MGNRLDTLDFIVFAIYFIVLISIAFWVSRKPKDHRRSAEDYFLAGRSLPWWIIGASLIASNISTEQIIGMNGTAFESGIAVISYSLIGAAITILLVGKFFLPKFLATKIYSMPEFLEKRYGKRVSTSMSVFWILVYVLVNLTSVLSLGAITLKAVVGIPILYSSEITARDQAFPVLIQKLLPAGYSGLVIAALIAAIISSLNSMCNSVATIFTMDIYRHFFKKQVTQRNMVLVGRIVTASALLIAVLVTPGIARMGRLFAFIQEYTGFVTPGVLVIFLLGMFWKKASENAALTAVLLTIPVSVVLKVTLPDVAFLNRMTITFLILLTISFFIAFSSKKKHPVPVKKEVPVKSSSLLFNVGSLIVTALIAAFYLIFW